MTADKHPGGKILSSGIGGDADTKAVKVSALVLRYVAERSAAKELTGHSPRTHRTVLLHFARLVGNPDIRQLRPAHIEKWKASRPKVSPDTIRTQLGTIRAFTSWATSRGYLKRDPARDVHPPRATRRVPRAPAPEQVDTLFAALPDHRARLVVSLLVMEGLRIGEVSRLEVGDVDVARKVMHVRLGKGGRDRQVPLTDATLRRLALYLGETAAANGPLIRSLTQPSRGLSSHYLTQLVSEWMRAAGVHRRAWDGYTAHSLRHRSTQDVLDAGGDVEDVQALLGHARGSSTWELYVRRKVRLDKLRKSMEGRRYGW